MEVLAKNKALVRTAFDALFNQKDLTAIDKYWSPDYIQHSAHIPPGPNGLKGLVSQLPESAKWDFALMLAEDDYVIVHSRYSGIEGPNWIVADIIRIENDLLVEHWDVIQDEATRESSISGLPMFKDAFGIK